MPLVTTTFNQKTLIRIAMVIAFVQFTNALEYMMFSPVFTFMAADFAVPVTFSGYVSGMYTSGAVLSGIIAFYWIDRCNKKHFLIANMVLLAMATLLTTFTTSFPLLLTLRFFAGLVGGTTMAVGITILINHTPADGDCVIFDGQHRGDARCTIFVYSLRLACRVVVNLYTVLVGIATDRLHHPSGSRHFRHVPRAAPRCRYFTVCFR